MRFGYCTGFASAFRDDVDESLLRSVKACGYDYAELPLMLTASLPCARFEELAALLRDLNLGADASCNLFPGEIRVVGRDRDPARIDDYLACAFERLDRLNTRTLVFGSTDARNLDPGMTEQQGYDQLAELILTKLLPLLRRYDIQLVMEPIHSGAGNYLFTLPDGMKVVNRIDDPHVMLLADSVHMLYEKEDPEDIVRYADYLCHIHICESGRILPVKGYTPPLRRILEALRRIGYNRTMSFEPLPYTPEGMRSALTLLRSFFEEPQS